jgi:hypothetical protein
MCGTKAILIGHHIAGRKIPLPEHPSNKANICPNCHQSVHEGVAIIERWVRGTSGKMLSWHLRGQPGLVGQDTIPYQIGAKS